MVARLLTPLAAAQALGVHVETVRREIRDGRLRAVRVRRALRIREADLAHYIEERVAADAPPATPLLKPIARSVPAAPRRRAGQVERLFSVVD